MKRLFLLMALCALACVSCDSEPTPEPQPEPQTQLNITSDEEFSFDYEGGEFTVTYEIIEPMEGKSVEATPKADWIEQTAAEDGSITFTVAPNETGEKRESTIHITYAYITKSITVKQFIETKLVLESETTMNIDAKGGKLNITYFINNMEDASEVEVTPSADWIEVVCIGKRKTELNIAENSATESRKATIALVFRNDEYIITINQEAAPIPEATYVELPYLSGIYFGNQYGATENDYDYSLALSNVENCIDIITGDVTLLENSTYLFLDLYASEPAEKLNVSFAIPEGKYLLDANDSATSGTIGATYSSLYITNDTEGEEIFFVNGSVIVTAEGIEAKLYDEDGNEYHCFCPQTAVDNSDNFGPAWAPEEQSTLTEDLNVEFSDGAIYAECYGDYYVIGKNTWMYFVDDYATGDSFCFELLTDVDAEYPVGTFPVSNDLNKEQMALPGYVNGDGNTMWSWYNLYNDNNDVISAAPIVDGEVVIMDNGDETFTVTIDVVDDLGYKLTGECVAYGEFYGTRSHMARRSLTSRK